MEAPQGADDVANRIVSVLRPPSLPDMAAIPTGALVLPRSYVERAGVQEVADGLTDPEDHRTPYAIVGMGGAGKSILAAAVVRKSSVREHFRGGIFWVRVGRGAKSSLLPHLQGLAREIGAAPTDAPHGVPPVLDSLEQVQQHLATVASMGNAPRLVVLDDVWEREVVDALLPLGLKVLVTTRDRSVVGVPTGYLMVGDMTEEEAMLLLLKTSMTVGRPGDAVRTQMTKVVALCGRLPLALAIVGSMPVVKGKGSTAGAWRKLIEECENVAWRMRARGECFTSVKVTLESSFDALSETLQAAVLKIAVLAAGAVATLEMLSNLWETEDMEGTREQAENLVSKCLLQDGDGGGYRVHDLVLDFVKMKIRAEEEMVEKVTALQAQFLGRLDVLKGYENSEHGAGNQGLFVLGALWRSVENLSGDSQLEVASYSASLGALESSEATVEVAGCFSSVGFLFNLQGKYLEAEPLYERVQAILEKCLGPDHPKVATALKNRGELSENQGKYDAAEPLYVRATAIFEKSFGRNHPKFASILTSRAELLLSQGKYTEADILLQEACVTLEMRLGHEHPDVASSLTCRANVLAAQGKFQEADPLLVRALEIQERTLGPDHPSLANSLCSRANLLQAQGKLEEADPLLVRALEIQERTLGTKHPSLADSLCSRASLLQAQGKLEEANPLLVRALEIQERTLGPEHPSLADGLCSRASLLQAQGKLEEADPLLVRALEIQERTLGPEHPSLADSRCSRASLLQAQGKYDEAESLYLRATRSFESALGRDHPKVVSSLASRAALLSAQGKNVEAGRLRDSIRAINSKRDEEGGEVPAPTEQKDEEGEEEKNDEQGFRWENSLCPYSKEASSGVDRLAYGVYADALAGLFSTGEADVLPAAVGIYAPWGSGKSFLLGNLKSRLQARDSQALPSLSATCCFCLAELLGRLRHSVVFVIVGVVANKLWTWLCSCCDAFRRSDVCKALGACFRRCSDAAGPKAFGACFRRCSHAAGPKALVTCFGSCRDGYSDVEASRKEGASSGTEFVVVEFNAWECAGLEVLWAVVITKIFDAVEKHTAFGRGAVRAVRIKSVLEDPSWNWCGFATFYVTVALLGIVVVLVLNATGAVDGINQVLRDLQWAVATLLLPGGLSLLNILVTMRSRGSLQTAQSALRKAISNKESVGEAHRGFMSEVKEELETLFLMINAYNAEVKRERGDEEKEAKEKKSKQVEIKKTLALAVIVDDLDRCSKNKIMEMLKATHLLLEQREAPMAVFLAVDPQLIVSAITESLEGVQNTMKALQYLDKIIHLPFYIPPLSEQRKINLVESLLNDNTCPKTLKRVKQFLKPNAPSKDDLETSAESIDKWCTKLYKLLDKSALELVCTLHWWKQTDSVAPRRKKPTDALEGLRVGLRKDSEAAWETRRAACLHLLETMCGTINTLMRIEAEDMSQAGSTETPPAPSSAGAGAAAAPDDGHDSASQLPQVDSTIAPISGQSIPASERDAEPALQQPSSRTDGEGIGDESNATGDSAARTQGDGPSRAGSGSEVLREDSSGNVADERSTSQSAAAPLHIFNCETSKAENDTFRALFKVVHATPRKIKRVVNVYFLQRSVAENKEWWKEDPETREKELVTWTVLAEFWPFRLSCIAFAMTNEAPEGKPSQANYAGNPNIASVYGDSTGDPSTSVCRWIDNYRGKGSAKDLFLSDDTEGRFRVAIKAGAQITKDTVANFLTEISFNLNRAMESTIEVEMVYDLPEIAERGVGFV